MEKIQENRCKQECSYVFVHAKYIKAHVCLYFLHLMLTFIPHYIIMVKGLFQHFYPHHIVTDKGLFTVGRKRTRATSV